MSTAIMSPITTTLYVPPPVSELSRSAATYYARSSSSLPRPTHPLWCHERSRTTFRVAAAVKHLRSSSSTLIDDDPDRDEEDHIRGIKRKNRNAVSTTSASNATVTTILLSPTTTSPSKRRCYPKMMLPFLQSVDPGIDRARGSSPRSFLADGNETDLLPRESSSSSSSAMTDRRSRPSPGFSSSLEPPSDRACDPTATDPDRERLRVERERGGGSPPDREGPMATLRSPGDDAKRPAKPPDFLRHATIRDRFDLACSMDEFASGAAMPLSS